MASSEGITFRWESFNRWCDEYADTHGGMKPKVEDVRKWHRENAEKVWPDSSERPSVFLAVSHNKGRRVRGHKTCEYYKRYRAGKAAEQQLAARLQPASLSGRRILAVTAAARKLNTDCGRTYGTYGKRASPDDLGQPGADLRNDSGNAGFGHVDKRRRVRAALTRPFGGGRRPSASMRRSSSDGMSEDPSWASGAETSREDGDRDDDDDSVSGAAAVGAGHRCPLPPSHPHSDSLPLNPRVLMHAPHLGVHITVVRRDADGRTIEVETQPSRGGGLNHNHEHLLRQTLFPSATPFAPANPMLPSDVVAAGSGRRQRASAPHDSEDVGEGLEVRAHDGGRGVRSRPGAAPRAHLNGATSFAASGADSFAEGALCSGNRPPPHQLQPQDSGGSEGWGWAGLHHPGVAPRACRRARGGGGCDPGTRPESGNERRRRRRRLPPQFCRYVPTPMGLVPVYSAGTAPGDRAAPVCHRAGGDAAEEAAGYGGSDPRDPLDLLAEAACDVLDSPRPAERGCGEEGEKEEGRPTEGTAGERTATQDDSGCKEAGVAARLAVGAGVEGSEGERAAADHHRSIDPRDPRERELEAPEAVCAVKMDCTGAAAAASMGGAGSDVVVSDAGQPGGVTDQQRQRGTPAAGSGGASASVAVKAEIEDEAARCGVQALPHFAPAGVDSGPLGAAAAMPAARLSVAPMECDDAATCDSRSATGCGKLHGQPQLLTTASSDVPAAAAPVSLPMPVPALRLAGAEEAVGAGGDGVNAHLFCRLQPRLSGGGCDGSDGRGAAPATAAAVDPAVGCTAAVLGDGAFVSKQPVMSAALETELVQRAAAADVAAALLQGQQAARLSLSAPAGVGALGLALGQVGVLPPSVPLAALAVAGTALPGVLPPPLPPPATATAMAAVAAPPPLLWPALAAGGHLGPILAGAPALAAAAASPLFTDASLLGGALAGAGAVSGAGGRLLPVMQLLQMQMAARGLDANVCHQDL